MAEDSENKPKLIINKKKSDAPQESAPAAPEKKKVVVVKKKPQAAPSETKSEASPRPVVRVVSESSQNKAAPAAEPAPVKESAPAPKAETPKTESTERKPRGVSSIELSPARPNVKMGNLADKGRGQNRYGDRNGQGGNRGQGGYDGERRPRDPNRSYNNNYNRNGQGGGFTGAQAREGFQNRNYGDRNNGQGGGYNRGGQGGFNRGGQGGFNRGPGGQGGQGGQRPYGNRPAGGPGGRPMGNRPAGLGGRPGFAPAAPMPDPKKVPAKKTFTKKKTQYSRKDREEDLDDKLYYQKKKAQAQLDAVPEKIEIMETVSVQDLAKKMNLKASDIIAKLFSMGMMVSINQSIDADTATLLASEYNCEVHIVSLYDETVIESEADEEGAVVPRPPVVTVMGHVDHGKTKTLDAIRSANVVATEFGGITQHIGAYQVDTPRGQITFLDTPGHEAFTMMRARGASITDIVILVVAADDGVMPQTVEAINHAKDAKVPIVVAVNKCDKPEANIDRVMTQLSEYGLTPEEWGGETQFVRISALRKEGIDDLLEAVLLQAEMLELKANNQCRAEGKIIETRIDHGRGVVSTIIVQRGCLEIGDPYVAGIYSGRVRAIFNDRGEKIQKAYPSMPVEILGLEAMPNAGDPFQVTEDEKEARAISQKRQELKRVEAAQAVKKVTLDNLYANIDDGKMTELKVIIKADVQGSAEALKQSLEKLSTKEIRLRVIHSSAGAINESDVMLASADGNAIIIGFNVRPTPKAKVLADQEKVDIRKYNVIYKCVEEITQAMEGMLQPDVKEEVIGQVEVRDTFRVPKVGVIAGCYVLEGTVKRTSTVNIIRDGIVIHNGKISSLKRFKDDAKEVTYGYECGIGIEDWHDIQVGDTFEVIEFVEVARKLGATLAEEAAKAEREGKAE
ncbi:MAG: translation initiation factor IF-2 [Treponemataceae bacterium]|nr:translation initiation factor IF-2 [Treponemataceae bacterium]